MSFWIFVNTTCYRHIVAFFRVIHHDNLGILSTPLVPQALYHCSERPRAGGLENAAIFGDLSTNNPKCDPTWDKSWDPTKEMGWKPAPSRHRVLAPQKC
jgi:hypothetical protein